MVIINKSSRSSAVRFVVDCVCHLTIAILPRGFVGLLVVFSTQKSAPTLVSGPGRNKVLADSPASSLRLTTDKQYFRQG